MVTTILAVLASTFGVISVFLVSQNALALRDRIQAQAETTARSVEGTLRTVMLNGRGDLASDVITRLRAIPDFRRVQVVRANGVEAFQDYVTLMDVQSVLRARGEEELASELYQRIVAVPRSGMRPARLADPAFSEAVTTGRAVTRSEVIDGEAVLTYFLPVRNDRACHQCHRKEQTTRGVIVLSIATQALRTGVFRESAMLLASLSLTALAIGLGLVFSLRRTVLRPIESLAGALAAPDPGRALDALPPSPTEEFGALAGSFRTSLERVRAAQVEVERVAAFPRFSPNPIVEISAGGAATYGNAAALAFRDQLDFARLEEILPAGMEAIARRCLAEGTAQVAEATPADRMLAWHFFPVAGNSVVYGYAEDVTERRQAEANLRHKEEQLRQSQKMEAIGLLAGGVAHDFNNLLTVVLGHIDLALMRLDEGHPGRRHAVTVREAVERATALTRDLLAFSRKQVLQPSVLDVNVVITRLAPMLDRLIGEHIELEMLPAARHPYVRADAGQLDQVLMNLIVNARDAMPDGGRLTVETGEVTLDERYAASHPGTRTGRHVLVAVTDTGSGMDAATRARLFEPFFTTKEAGRGTGLGLSTVYGIVKQSGGSIEVYSEVGQGTAFKVYLPAVDETPAAAAAPAAPRPRSGAERVLLVEDENALRDLARDLLEDAGYTVVTAAHGREALEIFRAEEGSFDVLVTDLVMPHLDGRRLAEQVHLMRPELPVLYMSGYADQAVVRHALLDPGTAFIQKPFTVDAFTARVREVLDAAAPAAAGAGVRETRT